MQLQEIVWVAADRVDLPQTWLFHSGIWKFEGTKFLSNNEYIPWRVRVQQVEVELRRLFVYRYTAGMADTTSRLTSSIIVYRYTAGMDVVNIRLSIHC
jgi:hypothetical protein